MTITDLERVVDLIGKVQPQVAITVAAVKGIAQWIARRRQRGELPPSDDAVMAAWQRAMDALAQADTSLDAAQRTIEAQLIALEATPPTPDPVPGPGPDRPHGLGRRKP